MFVDASTSLEPAGRLNIAVVGTGISGLSAAWLLSQKHDVTVFEAEGRPGGHSHTVDTCSKAGSVAVDTGFIVYNEATYPNLTALFAHLGTPTKASEMSFSVSIDDGDLEYSGADIAGIFAQKSNVLNLRFWSMLRDILRFYRNAPRDVAKLGLTTLGQYLDQNGYGEAFRQDHLYPMAAAVWSLPAKRVADYPAAAFVGFCQNHGLLKIADRPLWRTVDGGARTYVDALCAPFRDRLRLGAPVRSIRRELGGVFIRSEAGEEKFDQVVIGAHADQALAMLSDPTPDEQRILGAFRYSRNEAVLHEDVSLMPRRRKVWSSWNYAARRADPSAPVSVTYWMNRLQGIPNGTPRFVTLNPIVEPRAGLTIQRQICEHPIFNAEAVAAQDQLWSLQGRRGAWFCGAYFGSGFHEDGLQAGLAVAEALGSVRRPWRVANESGRIKLERPARESTGALAS
ncbi:NAD(P)/FAD-dependent oxidoreductase [Methylocapsa sp. S129]|uniref:NAD(P)/FAD-dependent oxidoreductase n=1 Tax=Methylocapsa sp. S129 TaxID=1641869 RepID=UPI00131E894D|nr:NAD(P)/FAD-dependent oxidoreductase [Methylocapsa sp. S129]